jgi:hypothetical protein
MAGVVNLYTREYFELVRSRLKPGGINTYWLPVHQLKERDARAILGAYCGAFPDCSLWTGSGLDWMLVGSRDAEGQGSESAFSLQWEDPTVGAQLRELGIEIPEQLGALFIADAEQLDGWVRDTPPLTDDRPQRLTNRFVTDPVSKEVFRSWMDTDAARERFFESAFIRRTWPEELRQRTGPYFDFQQLANHWMLNGTLGKIPPRERYQLFDRLLTQTQLHAPIAWFFDAAPSHVEVGKRWAHQGGELTEGRRGVIEVVTALSERDLPRAERAMGRLQRLRSRSPALLYARATLLARLGRTDEAAALAEGASDWLPRNAKAVAYWTWMEEDFGVSTAFAQLEPEVD